MAAHTLRRLLAGLAIVALSIPVRAGAQADPSNCSFSKTGVLPGPFVAIPLVGYSVVGSTNTADPSGTFDVVVHDYLNQPISNCQVCIDFSNSATMSPASVQYYPGVTVQSCSPPVVCATTDVNGLAHFDIMGAVNNLSILGPCTADVYATCCFGGNIKLATLPVVAFDIDGCNGLTINDLHLWLCKFGTGNQFCALDYDQTGGGLNVNDLSILTGVFDRGGSQLSAPLCSGTPSCPAPVIVTSLNAISVVQQDCGDTPDHYNVSGATPYCNVSTTADYTEFVATVTSPVAIPNLTGAELQFTISEAGGLDPYWQFYPFGCHQNGLVGVPPNQVQANCLDLSTAWSGPTELTSAVSLGALASLTGTPGEERVHVFMTPEGASCLGSVVANTPTTVLAFKIMHKTTCAGCNPTGAITITPTSITLTASTTGECSPACQSPQKGPLGVRSTDDVPTVVKFLAQPGDSDIIHIGPPQTQVGGGPNVPSEVQLRAAAPNPTDGSTLIRFGLPHEARVQLGIYDISGRELRELLQDSLPAGEHSFAWDGRSRTGAMLPSGVYYCHLRVDGRTLVRSVVLRGTP